MNDESGLTAENEAQETPAIKRRGPRKESEIRAEIEEQMRAEMAAQMDALRKEMLASVKPEPAVDAEALREQIKAEMEAERAAQEKEAAKTRALAAEARPINASAVDGDPEVAGSITVHFVEDGLTLLGKVWYRGEELTINPGTDNWGEAHAVLSLDEYEQEARWGKRFFREGLWRGKRLDEIDDEELTDVERDQLKKAARLREEKYGIVARSR